MDRLDMGTRIQLLAPVLTIPETEGELPVAIGSHAEAAYEEPIGYLPGWHYAAVSIDLIGHGNVERRVAVHEGWIREVPLKYRIRWIETTKCSAVVDATTLADMLGADVDALIDMDLGSDAAANSIDRALWELEKAEGNPDDVVCTDIEVEEETD